MPNDLFYFLHDKHLPCPFWQIDIKCTIELEQRQDGIPILICHTHNTETTQQQH